MNWLERIATPHPHATPIAVQRILQTTCMLGLTCSSELSEASGHFDYTFARATALDELVWNGTALLTPEGELLVNASGETELSMREPHLS